MHLKDFRVNGGRRKTLVVLGAGASRGASFVNSQVEVLPPLDADFFQQLSRLNDCTAATRLLEFVRQEYGHEAGLSMEAFFSEADYTNRFHDELNVDKGSKVKRYGKALEHFYEALATLLYESTSKNCEIHKALASRLNAEDTVLTFNYDCIMDRALCAASGKRWDPEKGGYGFPIVSGAAQWKNHGKGTGKKTDSTIKLLKMHGSANWSRDKNEEISLHDPKHRPKTLKGSIIPPTWFKDLTLDPYAGIWKAARLAVRSARVIVVIGYSVPQTDLFSRSLFKVEAGSKEKREKLDLLVLVNPDSRARRLFIDLIRGGLETTTRILEYRTLAEFGELIK